MAAIGVISRSRSGVWTGSWMESTVLPEPGQRRKTRYERCGARIERRGQRRGTRSETGDEEGLPQDEKRHKEGLPQDEERDNGRGEWCQRRCEADRIMTATCPGGSRFLRVSFRMNLRSRLIPKSLPTHGAHLQSSVKKTPGAKQIFTFRRKLMYATSSSVAYRGRFYSLYATK